MGRSFQKRTIQTLCCSRLHLCGGSVHKFDRSRRIKPVAKRLGAAGTLVRCSCLRLRRIRVVGVVVAVATFATTAAVSRFGLTRRPRLVQLRVVCRCGVVVLGLRLGRLRFGRHCGGCVGNGGADRLSNIGLGR